MNIYSNDINYILPKHADVTIIPSNLSIKRIDEILRSILVDYCQVSVIGFNNTFKYYWCKIEDNKKCILYAEIRLVQNDNYSSLVIVIMNNNFYYKGINKKNKQTFIDAIKEGIHLYQTSTFSHDYCEKI